MCLIESGQPVYPLDIVRTMRDQRAMMIQTPVSISVAHFRPDLWLVLIRFNLCAEPVPFRLRSDPESLRGGDRETVRDRTYREGGVNPSDSRRSKLLPVRMTLGSPSPPLEGSGRDRRKLEYRRKALLHFNSDKQWKGCFIYKKISGHWLMGTVNNVHFGIGETNVLLLSCQKLKWATIYVRMNSCIILRFPGCLFCFVFNSEQRVLVPSLPFSRLRLYTF